MKKFTLIFSILFLGLVNIAKADETNFRNGYNDSFIFIEGGVEFSIYPNGEFDFYYNPAFRRSSVVNISVPHVNISFNSGYNYDPYIQYDDYGAVIQIEQVPVYYDYYGRIVQAGDIVIDYDRYGYVMNVGNLFVQYDPYHRIAGYRGYINAYNRGYVYRPWHRYYRRPRANFSVVFNRPYRAYYQPSRITYVKHVNYYNTHHNRRSYKNFHRPGEKVRSYNRGRRVAERRDVRSNRSSSRRSDRVATRSQISRKDNNRSTRSTSSRNRNKTIIGSRNERSSTSRGTVNNSSSRSRNNARITNKRASENNNNSRRSTNSRSVRTAPRSSNSSANQRKAAVVKRERNASTRSANTRSQRTVKAQRPTQQKEVRRAATNRSRNTSARSSRSSNRSNARKTSRSQSSARNVRTRD
ncbi:hypothetical protein [Zunongwangia endophytica]|uniref:Sperm nuclear basic protein PL-I n=1 Tax=Zunongwangia endophytica TaxID=1808945 RepID=A0ABV8H1E5_9FLAO|nr:hypothetical protein [Zunongwangia endophytica]MDN3594516.1 hypothetical protein [Zunongwangia endophytica]